MGARSRLTSAGTHSGRVIIAEVVGRLEPVRTCPCATALATAIITHRDAIPDQTKQDLAPIVGRYL